MSVYVFSDVGYVRRYIPLPDGANPSFKTRIIKGASNRDIGNDFRYAMEEIRTFKNWEKLSNLFENLDRTIPEHITPEHEGAEHA